LPKKKAFRGKDIHVALIGEMRREKKGISSRLFPTKGGNSIRGEKGDPDI